MESITEILEKEKASKKCLLRKYYYRALKGKNLVEILDYQEPIWTGFRSFGGRKMYDLDVTDSKNRRRALYRIRNDLRRLTNTNFDSGSKFVTLTFKENMMDLSKANNEFKKFIKRLKYEVGNFKYIAVIEFQKRGAIHYHMISNLKYIPNKDLREIWNNGYVKINRIKQVDNVGAYIIKYMCKIEDVRLHKRKAYLRSRNLEYPKVLIGTDLEEFIEKNKDKLTKENQTYFNIFETKYHGLVYHREYNFKQTDAGKVAREKNLIKKFEKQCREEF